MIRDIIYIDRAFKGSEISEEDIKNADILIKHIERIAKHKIVFTRMSSESANNDEEFIRKINEH